MSFVRVRSLNRGCTNDFMIGTFTASHVLYKCLRPTYATVPILNSFVQQCAAVNTNLGFMRVPPQK